MLSLEGKQLGNYDVIRRIRVGGMGAVYEGRQRTAFDRRVAIKVILGNYASDRDMRRRFAREARTIARLHHPHILPLIEFGDEHGILYLVMPYIDGGTLTGYLRHGLPELSEVSAIYQQLLDAVEYAHDEGLIHRDIKSSNVLLEMRRSGPPYVYLADFGLVRTIHQVQAGKQLPLDQVPGTPHYMAPEQTRGLITPQTDIYALGVLLYLLLTGELPYNDPDDIRVIQMHLHSPIPSPCDYDSSIPYELGEVVRKAMAKRLRERYQSVAELRQAFLSALNEPSAVWPNDADIIRPESPVQQFSSTATLPEDLPTLSQPTYYEVAPGVEQLVKPRTTDEPIQRTRRNTEEIAPEPLSYIYKAQQPLQRPPAQSKPKPWPLLLTGAVPLILLILLLMPRVLGISFFPAGFPLFGTAPLATVRIIAQSQAVQKNYVLTASSAVHEPDPRTHTIPDRLLHSTASDSTVIRTTGSRSIAPTTAHGIILFTNDNDQAANFPAQFVLTSNSGVQVQLTQAIEVPPNQDGQAGRLLAPAQAIKAGAAGNIAAHALDGNCCKHGISAQNLDPFSGGMDTQVVHLVSQADLDAAQRMLSPRLKQQIAQQLQEQLSSSETLAGQPDYQITSLPSSPVGTQTDQIQVMVTVSGTVPAYNRNVVAKLTADLLTKQAAQSLGPAYQLQGTPTITGQPQAQPGPKGATYLSVSVRATWIYMHSAQQLQDWSQSIKGATPDAARAYLKAQAGVADVEIHLPFGTDHLPATVDEIKIVLGNK
ncbi:serine/threonine protein kinase [Ktedonosporobacter rubrisoli]|uniref:Serine/threonine protein kinase n=1 Tax=Ktedonosporobacter rubrisoli TaxID=2509675 RepID=A0A4P6JS11_KTERU|nr:serine/threonine-protein kinase [Ktedonosporobacter rubrisoli]QBD78164.1 serine/threonine protein kinase [Ktedonosporobacter rubrisoli]